jgi:hypothetical protein
LEALTQAENARIIRERHTWGEHPIADATLPSLLSPVRGAPTNGFLKVPGNFICENPEGSLSINIIENANWRMHEKH